MQTPDSLCWQAPITAAVDVLTFSGPGELQDAAANKNVRAMCFGREYFMRQGIGGTVDVKLVQGPA